MKNISVGMHRPHMNDIPEFALIPGHTFRPYRIGESDIWTRVQNEANEPFGGISRDTFINDFSAHEELMPERSWFVMNEAGGEVASITAWWRDVREETQGLIHWVAVLSECQGKGIGKAIMTHAMHRLAEEYDTAYLVTSSGRIAAIKVYLDFGFLPDMERDDAEDGWADVRAQLKHAALGNA